MNINEINSIVQDVVFLDIETSGDVYKRQLRFRSL